MINLDSRIDEISDKAGFAFLPVHEGIKQLITDVVEELVGEDEPEITANTPSPMSARNDLRDHIRTNLIEMLGGSDD